MRHQVRWTAQKIGRYLALITPLVYRRQHLLPPFLYHQASSTPLTTQQHPATDEQWVTIAPGTYWGAWKENFWLRTHFQLPMDWKTTTPTALYLPLGESGDFSHPEALVYVDGVAYAACDRHHQEVLLPSRWLDGERHQLGLHGWTGLGDGNKGLNTQLYMRPCMLVQIDQSTRKFIAMVRVVLETAESLSPHAPEKGLLLNALDAAFGCLDTREPFGEPFYQSVPDALNILQQGVAAAGRPLSVTVTAAGHAHIDVAWLWPLDQTRRKAERTFHTVLRLMEQFPEYHYTQSQPQLYEFVRQDQPALFEAIKQRVAEGRWELIGGMWVEADCNLSGAESLVRQFVIGRSFFQQHFGAGVESAVLWLPDVFGYAAALPQLIKQAGLEYFFTIKIGWNQYNRLPYDSFWWQGLDGSRVLTHFGTTTERAGQSQATYNANLTPLQLMNTWTNFQQKESQQTLMMSFGYGDGGGGPTREMLENMELLAAMPGMPQVRSGRMGDFFRHLEASSGAQLPTWNGELYLEYHRGTYTTQSRNKRANRKAEFLLHDAEFLAAFAHLLNPQHLYPADSLLAAWQLVCLNQFHDIIPGSSIGQVYVESQQQYREIERLGGQVRDAALAELARQVGGDLLLVNPSSFARQDLAFGAFHLAEGECVVAENGRILPTQPTATGTWIAPPSLAPYNITSLRRQPGKTPVHNTNLAVTPVSLSNDYLLVELNSDGDIVRIYDKVQGRELLPDGAIANQFQAFEDRPLNWDAWDIDIFYEDKQWLSQPATAVTITEAGPLRATLTIERQILHSHYTQHLSLAYNSPRLDITTIIEWQERHILLKVAFPVEILSPVATYEVQWGNVERPTHRNTSWDWARFESCAHKWVDLSEGDYGVSLLNDCKYGHDIHNHVMRISLLRSPTQPDPTADQGAHQFTYSLLPHAGAGKGETIAQAYALNNPLIIYHSAESQPFAGSLASLVAVNRPNVVIETVKWAEDGQGLIVRLYEAQRQRCQVTLTTSFRLEVAQRTNLLEEKSGEVDFEAHTVHFFIKPFEIVTLRLMPKR